MKWEKQLSVCLALTVIACVSDFIFITQHRSVAKNVGLFLAASVVFGFVGVFVGLCVNPITSERVNIE